MKSTLFASTLAAALTATSSGQVDVVLKGAGDEPWDTSWDGTTLSFFGPFKCYGYTAWDFFVSEEVTVAYQVQLMPCGQRYEPQVHNPLGPSGPFATIEADWHSLEQPLTWSGTFNLEPGIYSQIQFYQFEGTLTFELACPETDRDGDGVNDCDDGCPDDPFKSAPGECGCGVEDLDSDNDGVADCLEPVDVVPLQQCCNDAWSTNWDGTTLSFFQPPPVNECLGSTTWNFFVYEDVTVTYQVSLLSCGADKPNVYSEFDPGPFATITDSWWSDGLPGAWSGTFTLKPGAYEEIYFFSFQGTLTFELACQPGTDTDGDGVDDCDDGCPEDPFKSAPGDCGCGVEDLDSDKDGVADCNDGCPTDPNKTDPGACGCGNEDTDTDKDGTADCVDNCPEDPDKSEPGNCGCGVPETEVFGDLDCDGDYDIDDARLAMTTFGIEEAEEDTCPADVDGDGSIGFSDVLIILNDWGACP